MFLSDNKIWLGWGGYNIVVCKCGKMFKNEVNYCDLWGGGGKKGFFDFYFDIFEV